MERQIFGLTLVPAMAHAFLPGEWGWVKRRRKQVGILLSYWLGHPDRAKRYKSVPRLLSSKSHPGNQYIEHMAYQEQDTYSLKHSLASNAQFT